MQAPTRRACFEFIISRERNTHTHTLFNVRVGAYAAAAASALAPPHGTQCLTPVRNLFALLLGRRRSPGPALEVGRVLPPPWRLGGCSPLFTLLPPPSSFMFATVAATWLFFTPPLCQEFTVSKTKREEEKMCRCHKLRSGVFYVGEGRKVPLTFVKGWLWQLRRGGSTRAKTAHSNSSNRTGNENPTSGNPSDHQVVRIPPPLCL